MTINLIYRFCIFFVLLILFCCNKNIETKKIYYENINTVYPLSINTKNGHIFIDKKPEKIVSLTLATDEILFGLLNNNLYALSYLSTNKNFSNIADELDTNIKFIKGDNEAIISLAPDLIFIASYVSEDIKNSLKKTGASIYDIGYVKDIEDIENTIYNIASITDTRSNAVNIINSINSKLEVIKNKVDLIRDKSRILFLTTGGYTAGIDTTFDEISKKSGAINVASELSLEGHIEMPMEFLLKSNIDYLVISEYETNNEDIINFFKNHSIYGKIKAVREEKFIFIPFKTLSSTSQYIINAIEILYNKLYEKD